MRLRRATVEDAERLSLIGSATFLESFADDHDVDEVMRHLSEEHSPDWYRAWLSGPASCAWLVEEAVGCPVGYAMAQPASLPGADAPDDYELKRIYVLSKWQGSGWGARLFDAVEQQARTRGAARLVLSVYVTNVRAQRFYAKRGFTEIGSWVFPGFTTSEDFIYVKPLRSVGDRRAQ